MEKNKFKSEFLLLQMNYLFLLVRGLYNTVFSSCLPHVLRNTVFIKLVTEVVWSNS